MSHTYIAGQRRRTAPLHYYYTYTTQTLFTISVENLPLGTIKYIPGINERRQRWRKTQREREKYDRDGAGFRDFLSHELSRSYDYSRFSFTNPLSLFSYHHHHTCHIMSQSPIPGHYRKKKATEAEAEAEAEAETAQE